MEGALENPSPVNLLPALACQELCGNSEHHGPEPALHGSGRRAPGTSPQTQFQEELGGRGAHSTEAQGGAGHPLPKARPPWLQVQTEHHRVRKGRGEPRFPRGCVGKGPKPDAHRAKSAHVTPRR